MGGANKKRQCSARGCTQVTGSWLKKDGRWYCAEHAKLLWKPQQLDLFSGLTSQTGDAHVCGH